MNVSNEQITSLVERIVEALHPLRIILFGSTARHEARQDSDIDILIIMPDGTHRRNAITEAYRSLLGSQINADILVATVSDLANYAETPGLVYKEALREGIELYAA